MNNLTLLSRPLDTDRDHLLVVVFFASLFSAAPLLLLSTLMLVWSAEVSLSVSGRALLPHAVLAFSGLASAFWMCLLLSASPRLRREGRGRAHMQRSVMALLVLGVAGVLCAASMLTLVR